MSMEWKREMDRNLKETISHKILNIYSCNVRSIGNKKSTIQDIFDNNDVDIGILSEINTQNVPRFKGYQQFTLYSKKRFHGVTVCVKNGIAPNFIRIPHESAGFEIVHIMFREAPIPFHVLGLYLDVEARLTADEIRAINDKLKVIMNDILIRGEGIIAMGDLNRNIFSENLSLGSKLLIEYLEEGTMEVINDGDKHTRIDPATGQGSILDLCLLSSNIINCCKGFGVDTEKSITPFSVIKTAAGYEKRYTDHRAIMLQLQIPVFFKKPPNSEIVVNYSNKEGWTRLQEVSNRYADKMNEIIETYDDVNTIERKLSIIDIEIEHEAFGLVWKKNTKKQKKKDLKEIKQFFEEQVEDLEDALNEGMTGTDLSKKVYAIRNKIKGNKVKRQESMAINDPISGELITNPEEIKQKSLEHNMKILTKNKPREEDKEEIKEKHDNHEEIMKMTDTDAWSLNMNSYTKVLGNIKLKNKNMFKFFNKAGHRYKGSIFKFMEKLIKLEQIPFRYGNTSLVQIWKKKGSALDLNNMRFIHMRHWRCKLLEALITEEMKENIVRATPKMQLGGMPKTSSVEHLVVLKTWMMDKETKKEGGIFQTFDMSKFFDKESLLDCMYALNKKAKIDNKSYRLWYKINANTRISVKTSVGDSDFLSIFDSIGQGQNAAALVSSMNIGCAMEDTFQNKATSRIGRVNLNTVIFQDDIGKFNDSVDEARDGTKQIDNTLKRKLLSVNYDKSKYLLFGTTKQKKAMKNKIQKDPIVMGGTSLECATSEKYLGDQISDQGCEQSITDTIAERTRKLISKAEEIVQIAEHPWMASVGNALPAFKLFEAMIIPALLHNCESWIGINQKHYDELQKFQDNFIRRVLHLHVSTPKAILQWDIGMMPMKWRIIQKKMLFIRKVMHEKSITSLVKRVIYEEVQNDIKGLYYECQRASWDLGIDNVGLYDIDPLTIKSTIAERVKEEAEDAMLNSPKVADRVTDNEEDNTYIKHLSLPMCRIWIRYRARAIKGVKVNFKNSFRDYLRCRLCTANVNESQEHLEKCEGTAFERRGLRRLGVGYWRDVLLFWRRMKMKMATVTQDRVHQDEILSDIQYIFNVSC